MLRSFSLTHRHPRLGMFSRYLEGELDADDRRALESHLGSCARCQSALNSLESTVQELGSLKRDAPAGLADSLIATLRAESTPGLASPKPDPGLPTLTVVPGLSHRAPPRRSIRRPWPSDLRAAVRYCLAGRQLRLTLPVALIAGAVLIMANMGGQLLAGRFDLAMCATCTVDFLVPFFVLNVGLLALALSQGRNRSHPDRG